MQSQVLLKAYCIGRTCLAQIPHRTKTAELSTNYLPSCFLQTFSLQRVRCGVMFFIHTTICPMSSILPRVCPILWLVQGWWWRDVALEDNKRGMSTFFMVTGSRCAGFPARLFNDKTNKQNSVAEHLGFISVLNLQMCYLSTGYLFSQSSIKDILPCPVLWQESTVLTAQQISLSIQSQNPVKKYPHQNDPAIKKSDYTISLKFLFLLLDKLLQRAEVKA